jgi:hypothetical protein
MYVCNVCMCVCVCVFMYVIAKSRLILSLLCGLQDVFCFSFLIYPSVNLTLLMEAQDFSYGDIMAVAWSHKIMTYVAKS